jgi:hypothetical protein
MKYMKILDNFYIRGKGRMFGNVDITIPEKWEAIITVPQGKIKGFDKDMGDIL